MPTSMTASSVPTDAVRFLFPRGPHPSLQFLSAHRQADVPGGPRTYDFFWARSALFHGLRTLSLAPSSRVLVPSYICSAVVEPLLACGVAVDFYAIRSDLTPDVSDLVARLRRETVAVLAVHYFGFPTEIATLRALCDAHRVALIEDCAHVLGGTYHGRPLGSFGDFSVRSWRKFLPVYDGGSLTLTRGTPVTEPPRVSESLLLTAKVIKNMVEMALGGSTSRLMTSLSRLARHASRSCTDPDAPRSVAWAADPHSAAFDPRTATLPMSAISRYLRDHSDMDAIAARRRSNYLHLVRGLCGLPGVIVPFPALSDEICPWILAVKVPGIASAHMALRHAGLPVATWWADRPRGLERGRFPDADHLFDELIFLPVHQNLDPVHLDTMLSTIDELLVGSGHARARRKRAWPPDPSTLRSVS